jgi:hypothetical protein
MGFMLLLHGGRKDVPQPDRSLLWIVAVAIAAIVGAFALDPVPQDPAYHDFADARTLAGVTNTWNVLTNLPFLAAGALGLVALPRVQARMRAHYIVFCVGVTLVAFGSAYYHLDPSTQTLIWDRLPMTVAFMALFSATIADRVSWIVGRALLWPSVALGISSIAWWVYTEQAGAGDLRFYGVVQFLPMFLIPLLLLRKGKWLQAPWLWAGLAAYLGAKLAEHFDSVIFAAIGWVGGHSLKHLLAALASWWVVLAFQTAQITKVRPGTGQRSPASAL